MDNLPSAIPLSVYLVDDDRAVLESLAFVLDKAAFECNAFQDPEDFLEFLPIDGIGCVIVDQSMPAMSGTALLRELRARKVNNPVIFLTGCGTISTAVEAMQLGAIDYFEKPIEHARLLEAVNRSLQLDIQRFLDAQTRSTIDRKMEMLTTREREVMNFIIDGLLTKQIATKLGISIKTVEVHRSRLSKKLGVNSFAALVQLLNQYRDEGTDGG